MNTEDVVKLLSEAYDHLWHGRFRLALGAAQKVYEITPDDYNAALCYAWALLENGNPAKAIEIANLAVELNGNALNPKLYRGFFLSRMSIYEGALTDLDISIHTQQSLLTWAYLNKARSLAGLGRYFEALEEIEKAIVIDEAHSPQLKNAKKWYKIAMGFSSLETGRSLADLDLIAQGEEALKQKESWFALLVSRKVLSDKNLSDVHPKAQLLELEAMTAMYQYRPALEKAEKIKAVFSHDQKFLNIYNSLLKLNNKTPEDEIKDKTRQDIDKNFQDKNFLDKNFPDKNLQDKTKSGQDKIKASQDKSKRIEILDKIKKAVVPDKKKNEGLQEENKITVIPDSRDNEVKNDIHKIEGQEKIPNEPAGRIDFEAFENRFAEFVNAKMFEFNETIPSAESKKLIQFSERNACYIGCEAIFKNPFYNRHSSNFSGEILWFLNEKEVGRNPFIISVEKDWDFVSFVQSWGTDQPGFWKKGQGRVEIYFLGAKVCERWFLIGEKEVQEKVEPKKIIKKEDLQDFTPLIQTVKTSEINSSQNADKQNQQESLELLLKKLDSFTGLNRVKQSVRDFIDYLQFLNKRKNSGLKTTDGFTIHCVFQGNPGTGKTTIARLLGKIFKAMGLLENGHVVEVDRAALVGQYVGETAIKTDKVINDAMGGVLFIDEAYTLVKKSGSSQDFGQEAIDTLLKRMEDRQGDFVVIAAGYPEEMKTFLESNPGMNSRFTHFFDFEDYSPDELIEIFNISAFKEDYKIDENAAELLKKEFIRLYRNRDKTFGNARLVRNYFNEAKMKLSRRFIQLEESKKTKEAMTTITVDDIKHLLKTESHQETIIPIDEENLSLALEKLNKLAGIQSVKNEINETIKLVRYFKQQGKKIDEQFLSHIVFLGNPGTGKTTVARIFGEIYCALGILPKGHLVEADRKTIVAGYVGQTAKQTDEIINRSIGGTLFIDEAYTLSKSGDTKDFGQEAIDTLLKRMEDERGRFIVIAAGYTDEMQKFLESNPGLKSRFTRTITFEDYSPDELLAIAKALLDKEGKYFEDEALEALKKYFNEIYRNRDKTFGNARLVRTLIEDAKKNQLLRLADTAEENRTEDNPKCLKFVDIDNLVSAPKEKKIIRIEGNQEFLNQHLEKMNNLIGLDSVKKSVEKLINSIKVSRLREERGMAVIEKNLHSVFMGNPGTGKTTVARLLSKIYKEMGLLEKGHLVEVDRSSLVAGYQGQTAIKTESIIQKAIGGTLFIDEAYTLSRGSNDFGQEAIDTLLKRMEDLRGEFVVIVAGYPAEMKNFLDSNPGLQSRFSNIFIFDDYTPRQMLEVAANVASDSGYRLDEGALQFMLEIFSRIYSKRDKNFGNARTAKRILLESISSQEERIAGLYNLSDEDLITITIEDVEKISAKN